MNFEKIIEQYWDTSFNKYKIQQIKDEWLWLIKHDIFKNNNLNILEIGCYDGGSTYFLSRFAKNMVTIDNNDPCRFSVDDIKHESLENYDYIAGDSHDNRMVQYFKKYNWDFVFIDGDHSYEGVKADFYNILPFLKKHTPVAFHDIVISDFHHTHGCYVGEFWRDLKNENKMKCEEYSIDPNWGGIGLLYV